MPHACFLPNQDLGAWHQGHAFPTPGHSFWNVPPFLLPFYLSEPNDSHWDKDDFFLQLLPYFLHLFWRKTFQKCWLKLLSTSLPIFSFLSLLQLAFTLLFFWNCATLGQRQPMSLSNLKVTWLSLSYWTSHKHLAQLTTSLYRNTFFSWSSSFTGHFFFPDPTLSSVSSLFLENIFHMSGSHLGMPFLSIFPGQCPTCHSSYLSDHPL